MDEDQRREDFIRATALAMREAQLIRLSNRDEVTNWLRTVWLEARGEPWGEQPTPEPEELKRWFDQTATPEPGEDA